jgi:hypothetical protein
MQNIPTTLQPIDRRPRVVLPTQEFADAHEAARLLREAELVWIYGHGRRLWD